MSLLWGRLALIHTKNEIDIRRTAALSSGAARQKILAH